MRDAERVVMPWVEEGVVGEAVVAAPAAEERVRRAGVVVDMADRGLLEPTCMRVVECACS